MGNLYSIHVDFLTETLILAKLFKEYKFKIQLHLTFIITLTREVNLNIKACKKWQNFDQLYVSTHIFINNNIIALSLYAHAKFEVDQLCTNRLEFD